VVRSREARPSSIPACSSRVHRSQYSGDGHVKFAAQEGDGAVIRIDGHRAPGAGETREDSRG